MLNATLLKNQIISALEADPFFSSNLSVDAPAQVKYIEILSNTIINHFKQNAEIQVSIDPPMNQIFTLGVPVPNDGGTALKVAWTGATAVPNVHKANGKVSDLTGGIT